MKPLKFAVLGTGFWAQYQLSGWREVGGCQPVAVHNRTRSRAEAIAGQFGIEKVYESAEELLEKEKGNLDFIDIITDVGTHAPLVELAAAAGIPVVCQKPMGVSLEEARSMVEACDKAGVTLSINENWRWQTPIRGFKKTLDTEVVGRPFKATIDFVCSFPVFENQPFLADLEQFILTDIGSHILDTARFLFGEAESLYCRTIRVNPRIKGEDVATVIMDMISPDGNRTMVTCNMSYASRTERECFPQTFVLAECTEGSIELAPDFLVRVTTKDGTSVHRFTPPRYPWANPEYDVVHSSIVGAQANILEALRTGTPAETDSHDNIRTVELVFGSYESAATGAVLHLKGR